VAVQGLLQKQNIVNRVEKVSTLNKKSVSNETGETLSLFPVNWLTGAATGASPI
jgi:hypothetical protein